MKIKKEHEITEIRIETNYSEDKPYRVLFFEFDLCVKVLAFSTLKLALKVIDGMEETKK